MNRHRESFPTHDRVFHKGDERPQIACDQEDAEWITIEVQRYGVRSEMSFRYPADASKAAGLEQMLRTAYELGREAAQRDVRKALGIID